MAFGIQTMMWHGSMLFSLGVVWSFIAGGSLIRYQPELVAQAIKFSSILIGMGLALFVAGSVLYIAGP